MSAPDPERPVGGLRAEVARLRRRLAALEGQADAAAFEAATLARRLRTAEYTVAREHERAERLRVNLQDAVARGRDAAVPALVGSMLRLAEDEAAEIVASAVSYATQVREGAAAGIAARGLGLLADATGPAVLHQPNLHAAGGRSEVEEDFRIAMDQRRTEAIAEVEATLTAARTAARHVRETAEADAAGIVGRARAEAAGIVRAAQEREESAERTRRTVASLMAGIGAGLDEAMRVLERDPVDEPAVRAPAETTPASQPTRR